MKICRTTDGNFLGMELPGVFQIGDVLTIGDFEFTVMFKFTLENGHLVIGFPNYQIELEE